MLYPDFQELLQLGGQSSRLRLASRQKTLGAAAGDYKSPFRGQGLEFQEVRDYRPGDDVRNIDWRVTARMNRPYMKVFTEERERTVLLCIDAGAAMRFGTRGTFKSVQAARAAALIGWMAKAANDRIGGLIFGDVADGHKTFPPVRSRRALWQMLKLLSSVPASPATEMLLPEALTALDRAAPTGALVFVISDFRQLTDDVEKTLASLRRRCEVILVCVADPADRDLPPLAPVWFSGAPGVRVLAATGSRKGRDAYAKQWQNNRVRLETIVRRRRLGLIDLCTDEDVAAALARGLRRVDLNRGRQ